MMKIRELEAFDAYIRLGGMRSAADELGLSQPMISRLLIALETRVGFALFFRKRNKLIPTPEAFQFHQTVVRGLESIRSLSEEARAIANNQRGHLVIAAQPIFCDTFLIDAIADFQKTHPHVSVRLRDTGMSEIMRMVAERSCDMALGITLDADPYGADVTSLAICEARCLMPKNHPLSGLKEVTLQQLKRETFVDLAPGSPLRMRIDYMMQHIEVERSIVAETRTLHGIVSLVEMGVGLAIVDPVACLLLDDEKVVHCPLRPAIRWDIAQFVPSDRPLSGIGKAFSDVVARRVEILKTAGVID
nr:LysR family transcriptional regulator [uncultured Cohaesibacter sp.]